MNGVAKDNLHWTDSRRLESERTDDGATKHVWVVGMEITGGRRGMPRVQWEHGGNLKPVPAVVAVLVGAP